MESAAKLAFSVPVHENNDVVADLLSNFQKYNPGCVVVLHVSQLFGDFDIDGIVFN